MVKKLCNYLFSIGFILSAWGCVTYDPSELDNLNGEVKIIGHGGLGFSSWFPFNPYPANSIRSIQKALDREAEGIEVDVQMTADGEFILYHDEQLESKTNSSGCPSDFPLNELIKLQYQLGFPFDLFQNEHLISLDSLINYLKKEAEFPELHIDLRNHSLCKSLKENISREKEILVALMTKLQNYSLDPQRIVVINHSQSMMNEAIKMNLPCRLSFEVLGDVANGLRWARANDVKLLTFKPNFLNDSLSAELHKEGIEIITFGAKSKAGNKALLLKNPDVIQTNNIEALRDLLNQ